MQRFQYFQVLSFASSQGKTPLPESETKLEISLTTFSQYGFDNILRRKWRYLSTIKVSMSQLMSRFKSLSRSLKCNGICCNIGKRRSRFHAWLDSVLKNKNSLETFELGNKPKLREEAIDRENTLMNVLKSVKSKQSKEDLAAAAAETSTTSTKGRLCFWTLFWWLFWPQLHAHRSDMANTTFPKPIPIPGRRPKSIPIPGSYQSSIPICT